MQYRNGRPPRSKRQVSKSDWQKIPPSIDSDSILDRGWNQAQRLSEFVQLMGWPYDHRKACSEWPDDFFKIMFNGILNPEQIDAYLDFIIKNRIDYPRIAWPKQLVSVKVQNWLDGLIERHANKNKEQSNG